MPRKYILSGIYFSRSVVIALFVWLPLSPVSVYAFAVALGLLWLVDRADDQQPRRAHLRRPLPRDAGRVHVLQPPDRRFLGAWLGGGSYDQTGSYDVVWWLAIALGVVAGLVNLPIDEREIKRPVAAPA